MAIRKKSSVIVVGTSTVDAILALDSSGRLKSTTFRYGGVCNNAACVLGILGLNPKFISVGYLGDLGETIDLFFKKNQVLWEPLDEYSNLPYYQAKVDFKGSVTDELFVETDSLRLLTPSRLEAKLESIDSVDVLFTCTDMSVESLDYLHAYAQARNADIWVLSSSLVEVNKFRDINFLPNSLGLNIIEFEKLTGESYSSLEDIAKDAVQLIPQGGICLVTLGAKGCIVIEKKDLDPIAYFQPVTEIAGKSPVGAGDVLYSSILGHLMQEYNLFDALYQSSFLTQGFILSENPSISTLADFMNSTTRHVDDYKPRRIL